MPNKILILDDDPVSRGVLADILGKGGYKIIEASDGNEALKIVHKNQPDLIIVDILTSGKGGYEVCAELRNKSQTWDIPIIYITSSSKKSDMIKVLELGVADYIIKPIDPDEILVRVKSQLRVRYLAKKLIRANQELLKKQEYLDENLKAAAEIQRSLLPAANLNIKTIDMAWRFRPCDRIGGDIFNMFRLDEDSWAIYMLDVSGHGVPSALVAVSVSQILRPQIGFFMKRAISNPPYYEIVPPKEVLNMLDQQYPFERFNRFFTITYIILNTKTGHVRYANAGHPPPVVVRRDSTLEVLKEGGTIIGIGSYIPFREGNKQLFSGDKLFIYTDGILEYQNNKNLLFGPNRFYSELQRLKDRPISAILDSVIESMMEFGGNAEPNDDISILGIEFKGN